MEIKIGQRWQLRGIRIEIVGINPYEPTWRYNIKYTNHNGTRNDRIGVDYLKLNGFVLDEISEVKLIMEQYE